MGPQSLWISRKVPQVGIISSNRISATEKAVACLSGKASVQWGNIQTMTKTYEIHLQTSNGPLVNLKRPRATQTGFPALCFGQGETSEARTLLAFLVFPHQCWLIRGIILSVDQWFSTLGSSGNFRILEFLVGPDGQLVQSRVLSFCWTNNY